MTVDRVAATASILNNDKTPEFQSALQSQKPRTRMTKSQRIASAKKTLVEIAPGSSMVYNAPPFLAIGAFFYPAGGVSPMIGSGINAIAHYLFWSWWSEQK